MDGPALITGATSGLGRATAFELARRGHPLVLVVRDLDRGEATAREIREQHPGVVIEVRHGDLSDLTGVHVLADSLLVDGLLPRAVVCNAGLQVVDGVQRTGDGLEMTMATNVVGHVALLAPLLEHLRPGARIVTLGSETHRGGLRAFGFPAARWTGMRTLLDPPAEAPRSSNAGRVRYSTSKLACIALAYEIDRRWRDRGVRAVCFDPGLMPATGLAREYPPAVRAVYAALTPALVRMPGAGSVSESAGNLAWLAGDPAAEGLMGSYVSGRRARKSSPETYRDGIGAEIWETSLVAAGIDPVDA
ncbi:SDR family NAD(P)-dependent oxidoreductase [Isoptericola jiangsuensis]|uniref:SDR family NAD(P)-dependent oxidoreductase n=1 Tax=Isoptericola jiangsuensis TaxID=548579 RepID=UPI003AB0B07C